jgi:Na+/proline symporter
MSTIFGLLLAAWTLPIAASAILAAPCMVSRQYRAFVRRQLVGNPGA